MDNLINKANELLANGDINLFIGYEKGTRLPRPVFVSSIEDTGTLIFDEQCTGNLAVYLTRKDLIAGKKVGIAASYYALKSISQLYDENQIKEDSLKVFGSVDNSLKQFENIEEIKEYLKTATPPAKQTDDKLVSQIDAMTM